MAMVRHPACVFFFLCLRAAAGASAGVSVIFDQSKLDQEGKPRFAVRSGNHAGQVASGTFEDDLLTKGWGILNIETNGVAPDDDQAFAAGMVEGFLTARHIYTAQQNLYPSVFGANVTGLEGVSKEVVEFLDTQENWTRSMIKDHAATDSFWAHVGYLMKQYDGLVAGYAEAAAQKHVPELETFAFQMLNGVGDLFDIIPTVQKAKRIDWLKLDRKTAERLHASQGHCSGLIKLTGDFSDLFMAHSSWFTYSNTDRIFKHYHLKFKDASTAARRVSLSSYPGFLESLDDFYLLDSGLGWVQTTNSVLDHSVYDDVKPQSLLAWQRVRVASAMAHNGREWFDYVRRNHSGTYANQYMIVDFKLFKPSAPIAPDTLWVVEEMPGLIVGGDRSETLSRGYWPSYNVPYWPEVFKKSGYPPMVAKHGNYFTYELAPRAKIFRRDQATVVDMKSFKAIMRYNNYLKDPYALDPETKKPNPMSAICSRGDLREDSPTPGGCYDTKVTSYKFGAMELRAQAINGPSQSKGNGDLPPFSWKDAKFANRSHAGLPETYNFDFIDVQPQRPWTVAAGDVSRSVFV